MSYCACEYIAGKLILATLGSSDRTLESRSYWEVYIAGTFTGATYGSLTILKVNPLGEQILNRAAELCRSLTELLQSINGALMDL